MTPIIPCQNEYGQPIPTQQPDTSTRIPFPCCKSKKTCPKCPNDHQVPTIILSDAMPRRNSGHKCHKVTISVLADAKLVKTRCLKCPNDHQNPIIVLSDALLLRNLLSQVSQSSQRSTPCLMEKS